MPNIQFDRYYRYDALTALLHAYAEEYPQLVSVHSLGYSYEGRDIWLVTVTNQGSGPDNEKPALWVDANIHATELSPSTAALYLLHSLTTRYGQDDAITRAVDTRCFYICPRVNPDGAELALADVPRAIRSSTRPYPYDEDPLPGLEQQDIDGDGRMLQMRIPDPNGMWKPHPDEPRLLVRRDPAETGGTYYRVLPEGLLNDYDGVTIALQGRKENLDLNRNFPQNWRQDVNQMGAGPYPTSEPEVRAIVDFIANHRNITGGISLHTWSGVLLRPYSDQPDEAFPVADLRVYKHIGERGTQITGYPNVAVYHDFRYDPKEVISGVFDDWLYDHLGMFGWTVEIWSPRRQAGIENYTFIDWYLDHPVEDDLTLLKWSDEALQGKGYVDWYAFTHPQLGTVELGGWDMLYAWRNPPPQFLEQEVAPFTEWMVWHLLISPKLELHRVEVTPLGGDSYRVQMVVDNTGWLPSYVTKKALEKKVVRGLIAEITLPEGAQLKTGQYRVDLGQLEGRAYGSSALTIMGGGGETKERAKVEWIVSAPKGSRAQLIAKHDRAGVVRAEVLFG